MPLHDALYPMIREVSSREAAEAEAAKGRGWHVVALDAKGVPVQPPGRMGGLFGPRLRWFLVRDALGDDALVRSSAGAVAVTDPTGKLEATLMLSYAASCPRDQVERVAQSLFGNSTPADVLHGHLRSWA